MSKFGSGASLFPDRAAGRKRRVVGAVQVGVGLAVFLIAGLSFADLVVWPSAEVAAVKSPDTVAFNPVAPDQMAATGVCWHEWPYIRANCDDRTPAIGNPAIGNPAIGNPTFGNPTFGTPTLADRARARVRDVAVSRDVPVIAVPVIAAAPVDTPASAKAAAAIAAPAAVSTDGAGSAANVAPVTQAAPAAVGDLPERELTFKHGYALRRAVLAHPDAGPAPSAAPPAKVAQAKRKPRKVVQVYELPDGRRIVVDRRYGDAQADARTSGYRSAEMGPERFGQRFGARSNWFSPGGSSGLY